MSSSHWLRMLAPGLVLASGVLPWAVLEGQEAAVEEPVAAVEEELFVIDSLPYAPTSNTIATKLPVPLAWTPANVGVVGNPLLEEQGAQVLGDALQNVSGLNVQTGAGIFDFFVVRGFDSVDGSLVSIDGAPEPEATFYQLYNAERVEVLKGPGGFLYGSNPLSGAVNLVRKQPVPESFGVVSLEGGSFGTYGGQVDWNQANLGDNVDFRLNALYRDSEGHREGKDSRVWGVNPAVTWRLSERTRLLFNAEVLDFDASPDAGLPLVGGRLPDVSRDNAYESSFDRSTQEIARYQVDFETQISDRVTLRNKTYYRGLDWETNGTLLVGAFPNGFGGFVVARALTLLDDSQEFLGNQLEVVGTAETGAITHRVVAGVELARNTDQFTLDVANLDFVDLANPVDNTREPLFLIPGQSQAGDSKTTIVAPYVLDQMTLSDQVQVLVGVRFDAIEFEDVSSRSSRSDGEVSPILGVVYAPLPGFSLYANTSSAFAPPSARVVGERQPEESRGLEVGMRKELFEGRLRSTVSLFQIERENMAIPDANGFTQQTGDQRSRGAELELTAELGNRLNAVLAYGYTDSELTRFSQLVSLGPVPPFFLVFDRSGNTAAFAPEHLANLWVSKRFASGLGLGAGARYLSSQFIDVDNAAAIDDYMLFNAAVWYTLGDWRLTVNLKNLADEEHETRAFGSGSVIPGESRAFSLRIDYRL